MSLFGAIETSASGLTAQRLRLDLIANNIANINTTRTAETTEGGNPIPYRRQVAVFQPREAENNFSQELGLAMGSSGSTNSAGRGVQVAAVIEDQSPFALEYNPDSPDAAKVDEPGIPAGYVRKPNVDILTETVDMMSASRAYEANVTVLNASKAMSKKALEIGRG